MAEAAVRNRVNPKPRNSHKGENPSENGAFLPNKRPTIEPHERVVHYIVKRSLHVGQDLDLSDRRIGLPSRTTSHTRIQFAGENIELTLTDSGREAEDWVRQQKPKKCIVGLDVEWRPSFSKGVQNRTALLQLCTEKGCLILQILYVDFVPEVLVSFLKEPGIKFVGVGVGSDVVRLRRDHGLECKGEVVELGPLAAERLKQEGLQKMGLKGLAMAVLGWELSKPKKVCMSKWDSRRLNQKQIEYACIDAFVSLAIGKKLFETKPQTL